MTSKDSDQPVHPSTTARVLLYPFLDIPELWKTHPSGHIMLKQRRFNVDSTSFIVGFNGCILRRLTGSYISARSLRPIFNVAVSFHALVNYDSKLQALFNALNAIEA